MNLPSPSMMAVGAVSATTHSVPASDARRTTIQLQVLAGLAAAVVAALVAAVLLTVGHGFAESDEGYYLLLYRWWTERGPNFTGMQYIYGPVFDLLGHNIVALRVFRLVTVLATHTAFGWAFMSWLRTRRPYAAATRWWEVAGTLAIVACGGMIYSWLPLSAGYDDISTLGGLLAGAIVLRIIADVEREVPIPVWLPAMLGPVAVAMALAKWSSAVGTFAVVGVVGVMAVRRRGWREVGRLFAWAVGGLGATLVLAQVFLAPLVSIMIDIAKVNKNLALHTLPPSLVINMYIHEVIDFSRRAAGANVVLIVAAVVAVLARGRVWRWVGLGFAAVGAALSLRRILVDGTWVGGGINGTRTTIALIGLLFVALALSATAVVRDRLVRSPGSSLTAPGSRSWAVLAMLVLLPVTQAAGSNTGLLGMAINSFAAWGAVVIAIATGIEAAPAAARWLAAGVLAGVVAMSGTIAVTGLWLHPYLTPGRAVTTAAVSGVPAMAGLHLDPQTARDYSDLHDRLRPWIEPPGRPMMAFDQIAGLVLLLDGRPVGEAWTGAADPVRTANSMRADCLRPHGWWGGRAPILLFNRPVTNIEITTLSVCGYDFATDYRLLAPKEQTHGVEVYVPTTG